MLTWSCVTGLWPQILWKLRQEIQNLPEFQRYMLGTNLDAMDTWGKNACYLLWRAYIPVSSDPRTWDGELDVQYSLMGRGIFWIKVSLSLHRSSVSWLGVGGSLNTESLQVLFCKGRAFYKVALILKLGQIYKTSRRLEHTRSPIHVFLSSFLL